MGQAMSPLSNYENDFEKSELQSSHLREANTHTDSILNGTKLTFGVTEENDLINSAPVPDNTSSTLQCEGDEFINWDLANMWSPPKTPEHGSPRCDSPMVDLDETFDGNGDEPDEFLQTKYEFRPQTRELKRGFMSTWIDQDETGNFDPKEELRKERLYRHRLKLRSQHLARSTSDGLAGCDNDREVLPKVLPTLLVKLIFPNEAKSRFKELLDILPATNDHSQDVLNGYQLRKRNRSVAFNFKDAYEAKKSRHAPHLPDDPTGHPFARGCWQCVALGHECPLLGDETAWPCTTCLEDDDDCELVIPPEIKRACERCKRRRRGCSYTYTLNHGVACQQCMEDGYHCIAGPAKEAIRTRIRYDRDWANNPPPIKKARKAKQVSKCAECSEAGRSCSLPTGDGNRLPCEACKSNGDPCTLEHLIPQQRSKTEKHEVGVKRPAEEIPPASFPALKRSKPEKGADGVQKTVETKLCHPIVFNCEFNQSKRNSCHFCAEPGYGIVGLGKKEVEVIEWKDGSGLDEISGGHRGDGVEPTRLCSDCTTSRIGIIICPKHEMRPLSSAKRRAMDQNAALSELFSGASKKTRDWCAICPTLASYECRTAENGDIPGCGLKLCEDCMAIMVGAHDGNLGSMLAELKDEPTEDRVLGLRADCDLLKQDGLLMRHMLSGSR